MIFICQIFVTIFKFLAPLDLKLQEELLHSRHKQQQFHNKLLCNLSIKTSMQFFKPPIWRTNLTDTALQTLSHSVYTGKTQITHSMKCLYSSFSLNKFALITLTCVKCNIPFDSPSFNCYVF